MSFSTWWYHWNIKNLTLIHVKLESKQNSLSLNVYSTLFYSNHLSTVYSSTGSVTTQTCSLGLHSQRNVQCIRTDEYNGLFRGQNHRLSIYRYIHRIVILLLLYCSLLSLLCSTIGLLKVRTQLWEPSHSRYCDRDTVMDKPACLWNTVGSKLPVRNHGKIQINTSHIFVEKSNNTAYKN
jgi:hypothetical protein